MERVTLSSVRLNLNYCNLEQFVLNAITDRILPGIDKTRLMKEIKQRLKQKSQPNIDSDHLRAELGENSRKLENIKDSIEQGVDAGFIRERIERLQRERQSLETKLEASARQIQPQNLDEAVRKIMHLAQDLPSVMAQGNCRSLKQLLLSLAYSSDDIRPLRSGSSVSLYITTFSKPFC